jgi:hypothetical protein
MSYPPAPWKLKGICLVTLHLVETRRARPFLPPELNIVSVLPGRTLGGVFLASYGPGSMIEYNELTILPALARYQNKRGFWISHIYVDDTGSLAGGREIWGVPKELAQFTWEEGGHRRVEVCQDGRTLCRLDAGRPLRLWRQRMSLPMFGSKRPDLLRFQAKPEAELGLSGGRLQVPAPSPFAALGLGRPWMVVHGRQASFVYTTPETIGQV